MKTTILFIILFLNISLSYSQFYERLGVDVNGVTVSIWDQNISASCGTSYVPKVSLLNDSIAIIQQDTSKRLATCSCYYDVTVSLSNLPAGSYRVFIYRSRWRFNAAETVWYVGSLNFSISGTSPQPLTTSTLVSPCHDFPIVSVKEPPIVTNYTLLATYPNPFNPNTTIRYAIPHTESIEPEVFDQLGRVVAELVKENKEAGVYEIQFDGSRLGSGVYLCRLVAGQNILTNKLILLK